MNNEVNNINEEQMADSERAEKLEEMIDRMTETIIELRFEIAESNDTLRSMFEIAKRAGNQTDWNLIIQKLKTTLTRQNKLMNRYKIKLVK